ncbi:hypothetical protein HRH25_23180 [Flavisolibacter sp. BT320]|nr:hypothetical protein [Flavisolibacter longurius]
MDKRKIRCYKTLAKVTSSTYNHLVYYLAQEGWSNLSLTTCIKCGELFVIDWENPMTRDLSIQDVAGSKRCPICNSFLRETIMDYPKTIVLPNGQLGSYTPENIIPSDSESVIIEVFEIFPQ